MNKRLTGDKWEIRAESWLRQKGLKPLVRNFNCRLGEIDLIMQDQEVTVFVEVRYRGAGSRGSAMDSVTPGKQLKLCRAAGIFLSHNPARAGGPCRFDVIAIDGPEKQARWNWIRNAFEAPG